MMMNRRGDKVSSMSFLGPSRGKKIWTVEEDLLLKQLVENMSTGNWTAVAQSFPDRTGKQCRERWHNHLSAGIKKGEWTEEEDRIIITMQRAIGNQWAKITKMLPGRTDNAVKNRFHATERAKVRNKNAGEDGEIILPDPVLDAKIMSDYEAMSRAPTKKLATGIVSTEAQIVEDLPHAQARFDLGQSSIKRPVLPNVFDNDDNMNADDEIEYDEDDDDDYDVDPAHLSLTLNQFADLLPQQQQQPLRNHTGFIVPPTATQVTREIPISAINAAQEDLIADLMEIDILSFDEEEDFSEVPIPPAHYHHPQQQPPLHQGGNKSNDPSCCFLGFDWARNSNNHGNNNVQFQQQQQQQYYVPQPTQQAIQQDTRRGYNLCGLEARFGYSNQSSNLYNSNNDYQANNYQQVANNNYGQTQNLAYIQQQHVNAFYQSRQQQPPPQQHQQQQGYSNMSYGYPPRNSNNTNYISQPFNASLNTRMNN